MILNVPRTDESGQDDRALSELVLGEMGKMGVGELDDYREMKRWNIVLYASAFLRMFMG